MWCGQTQETKLQGFQAHRLSQTAPKVLVYDALATLNRDFEQVVADLERLQGLPIFPRRWQLQFLKVWRATLEETPSLGQFRGGRSPPSKGGTGMGSFARLRQRLQKPSEPPPTCQFPAQSGLRKSQRRK